MVHTEGGGTLGSGLKKQYTNGSSKALEMEVEDNLEELVALKKREELEDMYGMYGMPFIYIPSFISCLHRLNALLFALGSFLLIGAGCLRSCIPPPIPTSPPSILDLSFLLNPFSTSLTTYPTAIMTTTTKTPSRAIVFFLLPTLATLLLSAPPTHLILHGCRRGSGYTRTCL
ncbi:hypothetical protein BKA70DRAFT_823630 [Coprinopsis sp. MPI-PUGE-AT-0042]|nr:hypothetical protein BKA70DRAFT_823630 [Coprinopsis sp. MPI-PUGE-AT-0042]